MEQSQFYEKIKERVLGLKNLSEEEKAVMNRLWQHFVLKSGVKITQNSIAQSARWMGCHPKHEADIMANKLETTLRQVRQIIRDLRINHRVPILSDKQGYWICTSQEEASEYIASLEVKARAQAASWYETYRAMEDVLTVKSDFFDKLTP